MYEQLTSSEKLCALLDGELSAGDSGLLFFELAQNPELQDEFRDHLSMRKMFHSAQIVPPEGLKARILAGAGLGGALTYGASKIASSQIASISSVLTRSKGFLMVFSAVIGGILTSLFMQSNNSDNLISRNGFSEFPIFSRSAEIPDYSLAFLNNDDNKLNTKKLVPIVTSKNDNVILEPKQALIIAEQSDKNEDFVKPQYIVSAIETQTNHFESYTDDEFNVSLSPTSNSLDSFKPFPSVRSNITYENVKLDEISFQMRGFAMRSIPDLNIPPLDSPTLNNMALSLFYKFNQNLSAGIEIGQENFLQKYSGVDENNILIDYEQNYIGFWAGMALQYDFKEVEHPSYIYPITRIFIGGTKVGPLVRGMFALQYDYQNNFSFFTGLESSGLFYRFDGDIYVTQKLGVTFGASIKL